MCVTVCVCARVCVRALVCSLLNLGNYYNSILLVTAAAMGMQCHDMFLL